MFRKKKKAAEAQAEAEAKSFFDCIAPGTLKFFANHYIVGDTYRCAWVIREYPPSTEEQAILSHLADHSGVTLRVYNRLVEAYEQRQIANNATRKNRLKLGDTDINESIQAEQNLLDVQQLLITLSREKQPLLHCAVFLELKAKSLTALESLQSDIGMELTRAKITVDKLTLRQKEGFLSAMPFGGNRFGSQFERVLPASAVGNLFPFNFSGKTDPKGFYIGRDKYGTNILVDLDRRADDKTNSNILILGNSGFGKSYLRLYNLWYEQREDVLRTYTDHFPERVPLEKNPEFKSIRNAVIQEAMKLEKEIQRTAELEPWQDTVEFGLPSGDEPSVEDPEPVESKIDYAEDKEKREPHIYRVDGRDWWSDSYKSARNLLYETGEESAEVLSIFREEASRGNGYACYDIGRMYLIGQGCEENEEEAQRWFRQALEALITAEQAAEKKGYLQYRIGKCCAYGHGTEQSYEESAQWFQRAVESHSTVAAYSLGGQYLRGQGVEQSDREAYRLFTMAAVRGNAYAQYQLGKLCQNGDGIERDPEASRRWFSKAYRNFQEMEK